MLVCKNVISTMIDVGLVGYTLYLLKAYFHIFFSATDTRLKIIPYILFAVWQYINGLSVFPAYINIIITSIMVILVAIFAYKGQFFIKVIFSFSFIVIWMLMETCCGYLFMYLHINYMKPQTLGSILSNTLFLCVIWALKVFFSKEEIHELTVGYSIILMLIPTGSIFVINTIFRLSNKSYGHPESGSLVATIIILILNISIFKLYLKLAENLRVKKENTIYEKQIELYGKHQNEHELALLQLRNIRHEIKNYLITVLAYIENQEDEKASAFIREVLNDINAGKKKSNTGNIIIDSLMNYYSSVAEQKQILFTTRPSIPIQLPFKGADLGALLGNALDNAIEAAEKAKKKYVKVYINYDKYNLLITIINSYDGVLLQSVDGHLKTRKKDRDNHGMGIKIMKRTAEKYDGSVFLQYTENEFILKIVLYGYID